MVFLSLLRGEKMAKYTLKGKSILAVDDEPDILVVLEEEILGAYPDCQVDKANTFQEASGLLATRTYDLVILDIMGVRGFELLERAVGRGFPTVMLTAHSLSPEALRRSIEMGARAYIPKAKMGEVVPFLEEILQYEDVPGWGRLYENLKEYFDKRWGEYWQKSDEKFWKEFEDKIAK
jgi:CheY-like chemotaxis protein